MPKTIKPKTSRAKHPYGGYAHFGCRCAGCAPPKRAAKPVAKRTAKPAAKAPAKPVLASAYLNEKGRAAAYYFGAEYTANPGSSRLEYMSDCAFYYGKERYSDLSLEEKNEIQQAFNEGCAAEKRNMVSFR